MELTTHHFNPAGRLFEFLRHSTPETNIVLAELWEEYFEATAGTARFYLGVTAVLDLPRQIKNAVELLPQEALKYRSLELLVRPLPTAQDALEFGVLNLNQGADFLKEKLEGTTLHDLETCSGILQGTWQSDGDAPASSRELEEVLEKAKTLANQLLEVIKSTPNLDDELRLMLRDLVARIRRAAALHRVLGQEGLGQVRDQLVGALVANTNLADKVRSTPSIATKLAALVVVLGSVVSLFNGTVDAIENTQSVVKSIQGTSVADANMSAPAVSEGPPTTELP